MQFAFEQEKVSPWRLPWTTLAFVVASAVVLVLSQTDTRLEDTSFVRWGVVPAGFEPIKTLTHVFLYAHPMHLISSLLVLLVVAPPLEERWTALLFAPLLAVGAAASGTAYAYLVPASTIPMVGAAGASAALMGAALVRFRRGGMPFSAYRPGNGGVVALRLTLPVLAMLPVWFLGELAGSLGHYDGVTRGVAYWGQLGGLLAGGLFAFAIERSGIELRLFGQALENPSRQHPAIEAALVARESGHYEGAVQLLREAVGEGSNEPELVIHYWEMASLTGSPAEAAPAFQRLIERELAAGEARSAAAHWFELIQRVRGVEAPPRFLLQLAPLLRQMGRKNEAIDMLRAAARHPSLAPGLALRVVDLAGDLHPPTALRAARLALTSRDLHETKRERLVTLTHALEAQGVVEEPDPNPAEPDAYDERAIEIEPDDLHTRSVRPGDSQEASLEPFALSADGSRVEQENSGDLSGADIDLSDIPDPPVDLALHGLDLGADALDAGAMKAVVDEMPSTGVDYEAPPAPADPTQVMDSAAPAPSMPPAPPLSDVLDVIALDVADQARFHDVKIVDARPIQLEADRLGLEQAGGRRGHVEFARVDAVAVAAVRGLASKPVVVLDLLANWTSIEGGVLRAIRLRADQFDARALVPDAPDPGEAFKQLTRIVIEQCAAVALPDAQAALGQPFRVFEDLSQYEREVLQLDR